MTAVATTSQASPVVFVVDDDAAVRNSLKWLLESVGLAVEIFASAQDFLDAYRPDQPGCLLLDVRMPGMSGLELQKLLAARHCPLPVIVITGHGDVPMAVRAMKAGVFDFFEKPFNDQALFDRVQAAIQQDARRREELERAGEIRRRIESLTPRERDVMKLVVAGKSNKQIAADLGLSPKTIEVHRAQVMKKTQAPSVAELVRLCLAARPLEPLPAS